jgi:hypothetical protein
MDKRIRILALLFTYAFIMPAGIYFKGLFVEWKVVIASLCVSLVIGAIAKVAISNVRWMHK